MAGARKEELELILLDLLPADGSVVGNGRLSELWLQAAEAAGHSVHEADFTPVREELVARGLAIRGKGRGGSTG